MPYDRYNAKKKLAGSVSYHLSIEQIDRYEEEDPMVLLVPMGPNFPLGDPTKLIDAIAEVLPEIDPEDIDDVRPGFAWTDASSLKPAQKTNLQDVYGPVVKPADARRLPFCVSVWVAIVSINDGRAHSKRGHWPDGAVRLGEDLFFPKVDSSGSRRVESEKRTPAIDPDYFVGDEFGDPR